MLLVCGEVTGATMMVMSMRFRRFGLQNREVEADPQFDDVDSLLLMEMLFR